MPKSTGFDPLGIFGNKPRASDLVQCGTRHDVCGIRLLCTIYQVGTHTALWPLSIRRKEPLRVAVPMRAEERTEEMMNPSCHLECYKRGNYGSGSKNHKQETNQALKQTLIPPITSQLCHERSAYQHANPLSTNDDENHENN